MDTNTQEQTNSAGSAEADTVDYNRIPSYMIAADNHNVANNDMSGSEILKGLGGAAAGALGGQAVIPIPLVGAAIGAYVGWKTGSTDGQWAQASVYSATNSFYNSGITVANWFTPEEQTAQRDTAEWISSMDDDLGKYYTEHKDEVDTAGFVAGSMIPGMGALKAYNMGMKALGFTAKAGMFGANMEAATGLMKPMQMNFLAQASKDINSANTAFNILNKNTLGYIVTGVAEQALQGAIFETAVAATMFKSPIMEQMDAKDTVTNILHGALFAGGIGGLAESAMGYGVLRTSKIAAEHKMNPFRITQHPMEASDPADKIITHAEDKETAQNLAPELLDSIGNEFGNRPTHLLDAKVASINNSMRNAFHEIANGDEVLGNTLADITQSIGDAKTIASKVLGLAGVTRLLGMTKVEKELALARGRINNSKLADPKDLNMLGSMHIGHMQIYGDNAWEIVDQPTHMGLADQLKLGESISVTPSGIKAGSSNFIKVSHKAPIDMIKSTADEVEARWLHAITYEGKLPKGATLAEDDLPFLSKALTEHEDDSGFKILMRDKSTVEISNKEELLQLYLHNQARYIDELQKASAANHISSDPADVVAKLKMYTGVPFATADLGENTIAKTSAHPKLFGSTKRSEIFVNTKFLTQLPLSRLIQAVKHEEGHQMYDFIMAEGLMPANVKDAMLDEARKASKIVRSDRWESATKYNNITALEYLNDPHELMADLFSHVSHMGYDAIAKQYPMFYKTLNAMVKPISPEVINALVLKSHELTNAEVARRANVTMGWLEKTGHDPVGNADRFAYQKWAQDYTNKIQAGNNTVKNPTKILLQPQTIKMVYNSAQVNRLDGNLLSGISAIKQKQVLFQQANDRAVASVVPELATVLPEISDNLINSANPFEAKKGLANFVDANYGTLGMVAQKVGQILNKVIVDRISTAESRLKPVLDQFNGDQIATTELSILLNDLRGADKYVIDPTNAGRLIHRDVARYNVEVAKATADGKDVSKIKLPAKIMADAPDTILMKSAKVQKFIALHTAMNGKRIGGFQELRNAQGIMDIKDPNTVYSPPPNTKSFPHFAFVVDPTITGTGHVKMIYAGTSGELDELIARVPNEFKVLTKKQIEEDKTAHREYNRDLALNENYMDVALARKGVSMRYFPVTDSHKLTDELLQWHLEKERQLVREAVSTKYAKQMAELKRLGDQHTALALSKFSAASNAKYAEDYVPNPYNDYIKVMLDLQQGSNNPVWTSLNDQLDRGVSKIYNSITGAFLKTKSQEELDVVNKMMMEAGYKTAYQDAATDALVNHTAPKGVLTNFIRRANTLLAMPVLGDVMNAMNNIVGMSILQAPELQAIIKLGIKEGDAKFAGDLAGLAKIKVPGTQLQQLSASKLMCRAIKNYWARPELLEQARAEGNVFRHAQELHDVTGELALRGTESTAALNDKLDNAYNKVVGFFDKVRGVTGNKFAEEFTRFVAWDSMRQLTELGVKHGLMDNKLASAYRNTFVNRVQGNYLASQRPNMFAGSIGQAVGLFQTYQFNMMQQIFRHMTDGNKSAVATMMGLQSSIYGMSSLPAFQAINTYLIGGVNGNPNHKDAFTAAFGSLNHDAAEWLMYGASSNALGLFHPDLKMNMYSRGDINPHSVTIIPSSFSDIPAVRGVSKLFGSVFEAADQITSGGEASTSLLQGIEHAGYNRGLAGMAQILEGAFNPNYQAFSTTNSGNVSATNDMISWASLGRIMGAKPLDESIAIDAGFRYNAYQMMDNERLKALGGTIKTKLIGDEIPEGDEMDKFMQQYVSSGGRQENFNKYVMSMYKMANTAQANVIAGNLKSKFAVQMQDLMGGRVKDFSNSAPQQGEQIAE